MIIQNINNVNSENIVHIMGIISINNANCKQKINEGDDKNSGNMWSFYCTILLYYSLNYTILL